MAGNTLVVKHAPNVPQCALAFEKLFRNAASAGRLYERVPVERTSCQGHRGPAHQRSGPDGQRESGCGGRFGGQALKKSTLELGGSDAFIVATRRSQPFPRGRTAVRPARSPTPWHPHSRRGARDSRDRFASTPTEIGFLSLIFERLLFLNGLYDRNRHSVAACSRLRCCYRENPCSRATTSLFANAGKSREGRRLQHLWGRLARG